MNVICSNASYFLVNYPDGKKEIIKSSMLNFGSPSSDTAIARTVALASCHRRKDDP